MGSSITELLTLQQHRANSVARIGRAILARLARQKVLPPPELATGFEPTTQLPPGNERAFRNKSIVVKECVLVRHCEATTHRAVAFGLAESARGPYGVPNPADIKERIWVAHCLQFRRPGSLPTGRLGFEASKKSNLRSQSIGSQPGTREHRRRLLRLPSSAGAMAATLQAQRMQRLARSFRLAKSPFDSLHSLMAGH